MSVDSGFWRESLVIRPWREQLLKRILAVGAIVGVVALVPSVVAAFAEDAIFIGVADIVAYLLWLAVAFASRLPYRVRASVLVAIILFLGVMLMFTLGLVGASFIWLAAPVFVAVLLLPGAYVVATALVIVVSVTGCTVLLLHDALPWTLPVAAWFATVGNYLAVTAFVSAAVYALIAGITRALVDERSLSSERGLLISEIHHRVKNNLQTMVSLLRLQGAETTDPEAARSLSRAEVRVMAMAAAHELMHGPEASQFIEARALVDRVATDSTRLVGSHASVLTHGDEAPVPATHAVTLALLVAEVMVATLAALPDDDVGTRGIVELVVGRTGDTVAIEIGGRPLADPGMDLARSAIVEALRANLTAELAGSIVEGRLVHRISLRSPAAPTISAPRDSVYTSSGRTI